jgi:ABC-2 type transport system ATP-binding protein
MIAVDRVSKRFGSVTAVDDLTFDVPAGCIAGFLGPNGAGKTTTIRMLAGAVPADSGRLVVGGVDVGADPMEARRRIGYLPDNAPMPAELRAIEYLRFRCALFGVAPSDRARVIDHAIERCEVGAFRRHLVSALSRGMRQRLALAGALVTGAQVVILDEPGSGLDPTAALSFRALVRGLRGTHTVLFSSHNLAEVEATCDHLVLIDAGRLVAAGSRESLARAGAGSTTIVIEATLAPIDAIRQIAGVVAVRGEQRGSDWFRIEIEVDPAASLQDRIAEAAGLLIAQGGGVVRLLERATPSLEGIFARLVAPRGSGNRIGGRP